MSKIPDKIMLDVREHVFRILDENEYMSQRRTKSGEIIDKLVEHPDIGKKIAEYYGKEKVRTYIKDAIINRYTKEKTKAPDDWRPFIKELYHEDTDLVGCVKGVRLFRSESNNIYIMSHGRLLKWESALRKLLEYRASHSKAIEGFDAAPKCSLLLTNGGNVQTESDEKLLETALGTIGVKMKLLY